MNHSGGTHAALALALSLALSASAAGPASAATSADLQELKFPSVSYSHESQTTSIRVELIVADTSATPSTDDTGWDISLQATPLDYSGRHSGTTIDAEEISLVSIETPAPADGLSDAPDPVTGPRIPDVSPTGSLATPRIVQTAAPGHARGTYAQELVLSLRLPPGTRSGTYRGTVTSTVSPELHAAPTPPQVENAPNTQTTPEPEPTPPTHYTPFPEPTPDVPPASATTAESTPGTEPPVRSTPAPESTVSPTPEPGAAIKPEPALPPEPEPTITPSP